MKINNATLAILIATMIGTSAATAGIMVRTSSVSGYDQPVIMELVDEDTEQVLETYTFRFDDDGHPVLTSMVDVVAENKRIAKEAEGSAGSSASVGSVHDSDTANVSSGVIDIEATNVGDTNNTDNLSVKETTDEESRPSYWDKVRAGLAASAAKLEVLYESAKAKVQSLHSDEADAVAYTGPDSADLPTVEPAPQGVEPSEEVLQPEVVPEVTLPVQVVTPAK